MHNQQRPELLINGLPLSSVLAQHELQIAEVQKGRESRDDKYALNPPTIYTHENIVTKNGKQFLKIVLHNRDIFLPIINFGSDDKPTFIAIIDPREGVVAKNGAIELAHILKKLHTQLILTPPSSKSEKMVEKTRMIANITNKTLVLAGGSTQRDCQKHLYSRREVIDLIDDGTKYWTIECRPITLAPDQPSKFFGINETMLSQIVAAIQKGEEIAIVDDVYSSGATITAIIELITRALKEQSIRVPNIPIVVVAQERPVSDIHTTNVTDEEFEIFSPIVIPVLDSIE